MTPTVNPLKQIRDSLSQSIFYFSILSADFFNQHYLGPVDKKHLVVLRKKKDVVMETSAILNFEDTVSR